MTLPVAEAGLREEFLRRHLFATSPTNLGPSGRRYKHPGLGKDLTRREDGSSTPTDHILPIFLSRWRRILCLFRIPFPPIFHSYHRRYVGLDAISTMVSAFYNAKLTKGEFCIAWLAHSQAVSIGDGLRCNRCRWIFRMPET